ncbi:MAG TPA: trypsin-like serine protease [Solirubrobacterales bacterium]|nr:trypsin-like serine protease [Solirubrobacterales bacterium]
MIGGQAATAVEAPWLASIVAYAGYDGFPSAFSCTGTVVAPRVVLTAGHCVREGLNTVIDGRYFKVATGVTNLKDKERRVVSTVDRAIAYPSFELAKKQTDAGLLILSKPVTTPVLSIATAADAALAAPGAEVAIAGWGLTSHRGRTSPSTARTGTVEVQTDKYCRAHDGERPPFELAPYSPGLQLCAVDKPDHGTTACFGDSGGPAFALRPDGTPVEVGIVSSGGAYCSLHVPNTYTRVDAISDWILGWIATVEQGAVPPPMPTPSPPYLYLEGAAELNRTLLWFLFDRHFRRGLQKQVGCHKVAWEVAKCRNRWHQGGHRYYGRASFRLGVENGLAFLKVESTVHWIDEECDRVGGPGCRVRTRSQTFRTGLY